MRPTLNLDFANSKVIDPRITVSRASTARYTGADGIVRTAQPNELRIDHDPATGECKGVLIEGASTNLLTYSENFDNADWNKKRCSITPSAITAPNGELTASKLNEDASLNSTHYLSKAVSFIAGTTYSLSVFAKAGERSFLELAFLSTEFTNNVQEWYNLSTGDMGTQDSDTTGRSITNIGNGWYRCTLTVVATITTIGALNIRVANGISADWYTGDGTSGIYIWGAQLEVGSSPTSYIPTTSAQATRAADLVSMTGKNFSDWVNPSKGTLLAKYASGWQYNNVPPTSSLDLTKKVGDYTTAVGGCVSRVVYYPITLSDTTRTGVMS